MKNSVFKNKKGNIVDSLSDYIKKNNFSPQKFEVDSGLSQSYFYAVKNKKTDRIPRDKLLCMCIAFDFSPKKVDATLVQAGYTVSSNFYLREDEMRILEKYFSQEISKQEACHQIQLLYFSKKHNN